MRSLHFYPPYILLIVFITALTLRVALEPIPFYSAEPFAQQRVSFDGYYEISQNLFAGNGFTTKQSVPYAPDSERAPLYPYFLAALSALFGDPKLIFLVQALIGSASAILACLIARQFLSPAYALATGLLAALEPYTAYVAGVFFTETLFLFLFLAALYTFLGYLKERTATHIAMCGFLFGMAALVRPTVQYLPLALLIIMWLSHKRFDKKLLREGVIFIIIFLAVLSTWSIRNYTTFGSVQISDSLYKSLYGYLAPSSIALERGLGYQAAADEMFAKYGVREDEVSFSNAREMRTLALSELKRHPIGFAESVGVTMWAFFTHDAYTSMLENLGFAVSFSHPAISELVSHPSEAFAFLKTASRGVGWIPIAGRLFWILTSLLALVGTLLWARVRGITPELLLIVGIIAYFALTTIVVGLGVTGRYRIPVNPLLFILALYALEYFFSKRYSFRSVLYPRKSEGDA